jgi:choline monooxygenase
MADLKTDLIDPDICRARTLPAAFYRDPELFATLRERVFARSWQFLGDRDLVKVPGAVQPISLLDGCVDEPLLLTRDAADQIHLISNVCTHRGALVAEHAGCVQHLRCRYHGRRFGLDGRFQSMPETQGMVDFPSATDNLAKVPFGVWGRWLFASLAPTVPLDELLGELEPLLGWLPFDQFIFDPSRSRDYLVRANWALYCDNYLEGFHIPFVHPGLAPALDFGAYRTDIFRWSNVQVGIADGDIEVFDLPKSSPDYGQRIAGYYVWVFPNTMLNFYPWGLSVNIVKPLAVDRTRVSYLGWVWQGDKVEQSAGAALDRIEREDEDIVESVQRGLRGRLYERGRYSPSREQGVHHFHNLLSQALA